MYHSQGNCFDRCFPTSWPFYVGVIAPFAITYTFNTITFIIILTSVLRHQNNDKRASKLKKAYRKATIAFVLAVMFGVGWVFGILGIDVGQGRALSLLFQFLFIIIVGFQGLFIFILYPCRSKDARDWWTSWFYSATCRSQLYRRKMIENSTNQKSRGHSHSDPSVRHRTISIGVSSAGSGTPGPISRSSDRRTSSVAHGGSSIGHSTPFGLQPVDEGSPDDENSSSSNSSSMTESTSMVVSCAWPEAADYFHVTPAAR